jgi:DNA-binding response OmpR family regulator
MAQPVILIVDDDTELCGQLQRLLSREGWTIHAAHSAEEAERWLVAQRPSLVVLDVMLGDANGLDVCRRWHGRDAELPILMLSARGDPLDRVLGLEIGAEDYLAKPFDSRELVARIRVLLRRHRAAAPEPSTQLVFNGLCIDLLRREALVAGQVVPLTGVEFKLLVALARAGGSACSRELLNAAAQVQGYLPLARTVDVQVGRLRRKLCAVLPGPSWVLTLRGAGYAFAPGPAVVLSAHAGHGPGHHPDDGPAHAPAVSK